MEILYPFLTTSPFSRLYPEFGSRTRRRIRLFDSDQRLDGGSSAQDVRQQVGSSGSAEQRLSAATKTAAAKPEAAGNAATSRAAATRAIAD